MGSLLRIIDLGNLGMLVRSRFTIPVISPLARAQAQLAAFSRPSHLRCNWQWCKPEVAAVHQGWLSRRGAQITIQRSKRRITPNREALINIQDRQN